MAHICETQQLLPHTSTHRPLQSQQPTRPTHLLIYSAYSSACHITDPTLEKSFTKNNHVFVLFVIFQVWYTAITSPDRKQGGLSGATKANAGKAARKLRIEAVHILGVPTAAKTPGGAAAKAPKAPGGAAAAAPASGADKAPAKHAAAAPAPAAPVKAAPTGRAAPAKEAPAKGAPAKAAPAARAVTAKAASNGRPAAAKAARAAAKKEAAAVAAPVAATASVNGQAVAAAYDGKTGVLRITGLKDVIVGAPFALRWKI